MRVAALALVVSLTSCSFAVERPAATAAIVGATFGFTTCEIGTDFGAHVPCLAVGAGAALLLGGVVVLAILLGGEGNTVLNQPVDDTRPEPPSIDDPSPPAAPPDAPPAEPAPDAPPPAFEPVAPSPASPGRP